MTEHSFTELPDLASRALGGSVLSANDESFAERENLIRPERAEFSTESFGHKGKVYDGWETRRRREPGSDWAIVRLGAAGIIRGVVVDTAWFKGNYPAEASIEGTSIEGYPSADALTEAMWTTLVERAKLDGDTENLFDVKSDVRYTHIRLTIYPDGGVARFRVHGEPVPDPRFLPHTLDFAALENGGRVTDCSNRFYSSPTNLILPGRARTMGEGWENARRRDDGNDYVEFALAASTRVKLIELDTSYFLHNAPGAAAVSGRHSLSGEWVALLSRTPLQPDTRHLLRPSAQPLVDQVRLDVYPDGGLARVRLLGDLEDEAREALALRWFNSLPVTHATRLAQEAGGTEITRPITNVSQLGNVVPAW